MRLRSGLGAAGRRTAPIDATSTEAAAADAYHDHHNEFDALTFYEHLSQLSPHSAFYAEGPADSRSCPVQSDLDANMRAAEAACAKGDI